MEEKKDKRTYKRKVGDAGEDAACRMLRDEGYRIICRNFSCKTGEIDIVAYGPAADTLAFVEVKTRRNTDFGYPAEFVRPDKQRRLKLTAEYYLRRNPLLAGCGKRMDIIEILDTDRGMFGRHIENAF